MLRPHIPSVSAALALLILAGCATTHAAALSTQELQGRLLHLEALAQQRDQEMAQLRDDLEAERTARLALEQHVTGGAAPQATAASGGITIRQLQEALQRAGFDPGTIDGRMGKKTRAALRAFQQAQGLKVDGRIGPLTIAKLKAYPTASTGGEK